MVGIAIVMLDLDFQALKSKYASKPTKRIPAKREKPRVKRDLAPRPDKHEALTIYPDGREVCNGNNAGRMEYLRRTEEMWERQDSTCPICGEWISYNAITFDHENGRTSGHKDERIWTPEGLPQNAAVHGACNVERGSKRTPYQFQTKITKAEWEAKEKL